MILARITDKAGVILKTSGKYCRENILVTPITQTKSVTITSNGTTDIISDDGFCALSKVTVSVNIPLHENYGNAEGVKF